jgi:hypothetical protein
MDIGFHGFGFAVKRVIERFNSVRNKKIQKINIKIITNPTFGIYILKICNQR